MNSALRLAAALWIAGQGVAMADTNGGDWPEIVPADQAGPPELAAMADDFPYSGLMYRRIAGATFDSDPVAAREAVRGLIRAGGALSEAGMAQVRSLFDDADWEEFRALATHNAVPIRRSVAVGEVPAEFGLIEGLVHVPIGDNILVSSVTDRAIYLLRADGWERFASRGVATPDGELRMGSPMGMANDIDRGWIWVASSIVDQTPEGDNAFSGLIGISPDQTEILWLPAEEGAQPGDVALAPNGDVYVSDAARGAVYVRRVGATELERVIEPGRLRSAQGLAVAPDGSALIVADYSYGLARYDFESRALDQVEAFDGAMLDGIDGLMRHGGDLIAIRNGVRPHAILRLGIDPAGRSVRRIEPLERAHPDWGEPTLGTIFGDTLYYVADARWADFGEGGALNEGAVPRATHIRALDLSNASDSQENPADSSR